MALTTSQHKAYLFLISDLSIIEQIARPKNDRERPSQGLGRLGSHSRNDENHRRTLLLLLALLLGDDTWQAWHWTGNQGCSGDANSGKIPFKVY